MWEKQEGAGAAWRWKGPGPEPDLTTPVAQLQHHRQALLDNTWVRKCPQGPEEVCLVMQGVGPSLSTRAINLLHKAWKELVPEESPGTTITHWNDQPSRMFSEVMAVIDRAIILAKEARA